jgi:hypothetical protein
MDRLPDHDIGMSRSAHRAVEGVHAGLERLYARLPALAVVFRERPVVLSEDVVGCAVRADGQLYVNPVDAQGETPAERAELETGLARAALLLLGRGFERGVGRSALAWNAALTQELDALLPALGLSRPMDDSTETPVTAEAQYAARVDRETPPSAPLASDQVPDAALRAFLDAIARALIAGHSTPTAIRAYLLRTHA